MIAKVTLYSNEGATIVEHVFDLMLGDFEWNVPHDPFIEKGMRLYGYTFTPKIAFPIIEDKEIA